MLNILTGRKTYILAALGGVVTVAHLLGWIDGELYMAVMGLLGFGTVAALRAGVAKS